MYIKPVFKKYTAPRNHILLPHNIGAAAATATTTTTTNFNSKTANYIISSY
jgi:hypothetical protein